MSRKQKLEYAGGNNRSVTVGNDDDDLEYEYEFEEGSEMMADIAANYSSKLRHLGTLPSR